MSYLMTVDQLYVLAIYSTVVSARRTFCHKIFIFLALVACGLRGAPWVLDAIPALQGGEHDSNATAWRYRQRVGRRRDYALHGSD